MMDLYGGKVWYEDNEQTGAVAVLEFRRTDDCPETDTDTEESPAAEMEPNESGGVKRHPDVYPADLPTAEAQGKSRDTQ